MDSYYHPVRSQLIQLLFPGELLSEKIFDLLGGLLHTHCPGSEGLSTSGLIMLFNIGRLEPSALFLCSQPLLVAVFLQWQLIDTSFLSLFLLDRISMILLRAFLLLSMLLLVLEYSFSKWATLLLICRYCSKVRFRLSLAYSNVCPMPMNSGSIHSSCLLLEAVVTGVRF